MSPVRPGKYTISNGDGSRKDPGNPPWAGPRDSPECWSSNGRQNDPMLANLIVTIRLIVRPQPDLLSPALHEHQADHRRNTFLA